MTCDAPIVAEVLRLFRMQDAMAAQLRRQLLGVEVLLLEEQSAWCHPAINCAVWRKTFSRITAFLDQAPMAVLYTPIPLGT